jgi:diacylglycerol kinase family enzyme
MSSSEKMEKERLGRLAYIVAGAKSLLGFQPRRFHIRLDGAELVLKAAELLVLNSGTLGDPSLRWGREIRIDDGQLEVCVIRAKNLGDTLRVGLQLLSGGRRGDSDPQLTCYPLEGHIRIDSPISEQVQADGELIGETPVTIELLSHVVEVVVPVSRERA